MNLNVYIHNYIIIIPNLVYMTMTINVPTCDISGIEYTDI